MEQNEGMSGVATAMVTFAPRSVFEELHGPAASRLWRPGYLACLIEKHLPVWVISPIGFAAGGEPDHLVVVSHSLDGRPAIADVVVAMAGLFGGRHELQRLALTEGLLSQHGEHFVAMPSVEMPIWDDGEDDESGEAPPIVGSDALVAEAARIVSEKCRVTVTAYPDSIVATEQSVHWLRAKGIDVDEFTYTPMGQLP